MSTAKWKLAEIGTLKINDKNPRTIKDQRFRLLVKSIKEFPQMMEIRPIVVNGDMVVLGGNMRLRACIAAGLKEVPIIVADNLTPEQQQEFIAKDNIDYGDWDWPALQSEWDTIKLESWGMELPPVAEIGKTVTKELDAAYQRVHVLISVHPSYFAEIQKALESIKQNPNVEYEQSAN